MGLLTRAGDRDRARLANDRLNGLRSSKPTVSGSGRGDP